MRGEIRQTVFSPRNPSDGVLGWFLLLGLAACAPTPTDHYDLGRRAAVDGRLEEARKQFDQALQVDPEFTEAWYWRGACKARLGGRAAKEGRDEEALALFWDGVEDKKKAKELMDRGIFKAWTPDERDRAQKDIEATMKAVEEGTDDEDAILEALRLSRP